MVLSEEEAAIAGSRLCSSGNLARLLLQACATPLKFKLARVIIARVWYGAVCTLCIFCVHMCDVEMTAMQRVFSSLFLHMTVFLCVNLCVASL
jgi:hypothetical protein